VNKHRIIVSFLALIACVCVDARADVTARKDAADPQLIVMRNAQLVAIIDLSRGAHVVSFKYRGFDDAEIVFDYKTENGGLFKDLWYTQGWPGEFDKRLYEAELVSAGPDEAVVKTWTVSTGTAGSKLQADLADIRLVKTFRLRRGERALRVDYELTNQSAKGKRPAFWAQHAFNFGDRLQPLIYWRPTRHGVDSTGRNGMSIPFSEKTAKGYWQTANITAGWNGAANRALKRGVVFLIDYNDVQQVYNNWGANTLEWMYDDAAIPAGKTWRTSVQMVPTEGFAGYSHADGNVVAFTEGLITPAGLAITHTVAATDGDLRDVTVRTEARELKGAWTVVGEDVKLDRLGTAPMTRTVNLAGVGALPCVLRITISGQGPAGTAVTASYADFFDGPSGRNIDLTTLGPLVEFPAPEKMKTYLKPDTLALQRAKPPRILFVRGLWAEFQGVEEAAKRLGDVVVTNAWMKKAALGETLGNFPGSYEDLLGYDVIILGNISGPMLSSVGQEMLADFLKAGGGVLMLAGDRTYGQTVFSNTNFADRLPYVSTGRGDYGRLAKPSALQMKDAHPATAGTAFAKTGAVLYAHRLKARAGALVPVTLDDGSAALIVSGPGLPRVAAVAVLPFGEAPAGRQLYGQTAEWQQVMAGTLEWLLGRRN
jgi:uncharacterized membrane protein